MKAFVTFRSRSVHFATVLTLSVMAGACGDADMDDDGMMDDDANAPAAAAPAPAPMSGSDMAGALVNPSTATRDQLAGLPGMTPELADAVVAGRPYEDMLEVDAVLEESLDGAQREALYATLFLPLDLNSASSDEIQLIPGVADRMTHEFEEYRPYADMAQFRREIGKYVDEAEVARLERYVMIR